jgi:hypothetical protein
MRDGRDADSALKPMRMVTSCQEAHKIIVLYGITRQLWNYSGMWRKPRWQTKTIDTDCFEGWKTRATARAMDRGERIAPSRTITLESALTMLRLMTPGRMRVLNTVRQRRSTVSALAKRLTRDVSAVSRDVAAMEKVAC